MNNKESLKTTILWWLGTFISLLLIVFNVVFYEMLKKDFYANVKTSLSVGANQVKDKLLISKDKAVTIPEKLNYELHSAMVAVVAAQNMEVVTQSVVFLNTPMQQYLKSDKSSFIINTQEYGKVSLYVLRIISPLKGYIIMAVSLKDVDEKLKSIFLTMIILNPILLILLLLGANLIINRILNPIKNITKIANELSVGDMEKTIPLPLQKDEIYELVHSFNKMVIRLYDGVNAMDRFNADVSHELRTPLTVLKGEMDIALRKTRDVEYYQNTLKLALKEVNYLNQMIEELLFFTKIDTQTSKFNMCNADEILLDVIDVLLNKAHKKNIKLNLLRIEAIEILANQVLLQAIFTNIIDNSIKYTPINKNINIWMYVENEILIFRVKDEGIGVKQEDLQNLTQRFYRVEASRNREIKGFGLGLYIVKKSLNILQGDIKFTSEDENGLDVVITIPCQKTKNMI